MRTRSTSGHIHLFGLFFLIVLIAGAVAALRTVNRVSDLQAQLNEVEHKLDLYDVRLKNLEGK
jgi:hypothetical protein